ncbi:hypothetical protein D3C86_1692030 [compost metagenome]
MHEPQLLGHEAQMQRVHRHHIVAIAVGVCRLETQAAVLHQFDLQGRHLFGPAGGGFGRHAATLVKTAWVHGFSR